MMYIRIILLAFSLACFLVDTWKSDHPTGFTCIGLALFVLSPLLGSTPFPL